jgi:hypothetical protein
MLCLQLIILLKYNYKFHKSCSRVKVMVTGTQDPERVGQARVKPDLTLP